MTSNLLGSPKRLWFYLLQLLYMETVDSLTHLSKNMPAIIVVVTVASLVIFSNRRRAQRQIDAGNNLRQSLQQANFSVTQAVIPAYSWLARIATANDAWSDITTSLAMTGLVASNRANVFLFSFWIGKFTRAAVLRENTVVEVLLNRAPGNVYVARRLIPSFWTTHLGPTWNYDMLPKIDVSPTGQKYNLKALCEEATSVEFNSGFLTPFQQLPLMWDMEIKDKSLFLYSPRFTNSNELADVLKQIPALTAAIEGAQIFGSKLEP